MVPILLLGLIWLPSAQSSVCPGHETVRHRMAKGPCASSSRLLRWFLAVIVGRTSRDKSRLKSLRPSMMLASFWPVSLATFDKGRC